MKNTVTPLLIAAALALAPCGSFAQVATAPASPATPSNPPRPPKPAPAPPSEGFSESLAAATQEAQKAAREAMKQVGGFSERLANVIARVPAPNNALVIPKDEADAKAIATTEEDLNVMAHILDKVPANPDRKGRRAMGISVRASGGGTPQNIYLDGYGAIFFLNVNYPLSAPPEPPAKGEAKAEPSEWDEARRELFQPPQPSELKWENEFKYGEIFTSGGPAEPYDAEKVEALQKGLIAELNNASHIRSLKGNETVTIVVTSRSGAGAKQVYIRKNSSGVNAGGGYGGGSSSSSARASGSSTQDGPGSVTIEQNITAPSANRGNTMIIRADKESIDAFANNKLSLDEFRKKVTAFIY